MKEFVKIIDVDKEKCVNCHRCISVCPVKMCNDGSGDHITINANMCIGCGACLEACTHKARYGVDDLEAFLCAAREGQPLLAVVAPGAAASFPDLYLRLNGWLHSLGVTAVFDVGFGAELAVKSYVEYITAHKPRTVIAQPCPVIVNYIEIYRPQLRKYLAPVHSPMAHAMRMIQTYYPEHTSHRIVALTPCFAKKREFAATGLGDFNVTFRSLRKYFQENGIALDDFPEKDYANPSAERGVMFSAPGGLLETIRRDLPGIETRTRRIEGPSVYAYLAGLHETIEAGKAPLLVDCLNCDKGCNGGPGTDLGDRHLDEVEYPVRRRMETARRRYENDSQLSGIPARKLVQSIIGAYWKPGLYERDYQDRSENNSVREPDEQQLNQVYLAMHKFKESDFYHCAACGYNDCRSMAVAVFNRLNKKENCHHYWFFMNKM